MTTPRDDAKAVRGRRRMFAVAKQAVFTSRTPPPRTTTRASQVRDRMFNGNTAAMAASYGVAPRTVNRWMTGERTPQGANAEQLHRDATAVQTTERGRKRRAKELKARGGASSGHRAHVGRAGTFTIRGSDAVRQRDIDLDLTGEEAAALAVAEDDEEVRGIIGDAIARYFNGGGVYGGFHGEDFDFDADTFHLS